MLMDSALSYHCECWLLLRKPWLLARLRSTSYVSPFYLQGLRCLFLRVLFIWNSNYSLIRALLNLSLLNFSGPSFLWALSNFNFLWLNCYLKRLLVEIRVYTLTFHSIISFIKLCILLNNIDYRLLISTS